MKAKCIAWAMLTGVVLARSRADGGAVKPAWLTDCSVSVKEGYDDNVFQSGVNARDLPAAYPVPPGSVAALKNEASWVTTVSPKIGVNISPLLDSPTNLPLLALAYAPDFAIYHQQTSESGNAHRVLAAVKMKTDAATLNSDNTFTFLDGSGMGPVFPGNLYSGFATIGARARRRQMLDTANFSLQFPGGDWFIRPAATLLYNDMLTRQLDNALPQYAGYQNYCDRYDVNGGADLGWQLAPACALTLGYRYGHQYQQQYSFSPYSASSDYQRVLAGIEGRPWSWLTVKAVSGPDFRRYQENSPGHITPVSDRTPVKYYGEAQATVYFDRANTLTFRYRLWEWVSGTGKVPYADGGYELAYHGALTKRLGWDLGGKLSVWDFTSGNLAACQRRDLLYTASTGITCAINSHVSVGVSGILNWGRNGQDAVANNGTREFNQQMVVVSTQTTF